MHLVCVYTKIFILKFIRHLTYVACYVGRRKDIKFRHIIEFFEMSQNFSRLKIENSSDFLCVVKVNILFVEMNDYEYTNE